ncbi:MAG: hypothetical protein R3E53_03645 [Myxococcota bacterium]
MARYRVAQAPSTTKRSPGCSRGWRELAGVDGVAWSTAELGALRARPLRDPRAARDRILRAADTAE